MKSKRLLIFILAIAMVSISAIQVFANAEIDNLKKQQEEMERQKKEKEGEIQGLQVQVKDVQGEIAKLDAQIDVASVKLTEVEDVVAQLEVDIAHNQEKLEGAKSSLDENQDTLEKRLRIMYMSGDSSNLEILLGADNIEDMLMRYDMLEMVAKQDKDLISFTNKQIVTIEETEAELSRQHAEEEIKRKELSRQKQNLVTANDQKVSFMAQLQKDKAAAEAQYDGFVQESLNIQGKIVAKEKELEERRKAEAAKRKAAGRAVSGSGQLSWPVSGYNSISSYYGYRIHPIFNTKKYHAGIDIPAPTGTAIKAASDGIVISSGWQGGYGKAVVVSHGNGLVTLYGHNSTLKVSEGDYVSKGDTIALCGSTGYSTGPHCHFEVRVNGATVDPLGYL